MLKLVDLFFTCFHTLLILFNIFGWLHPVTRKWNLLTLILTGASWLGLGFFYGFGYCPLTDWHFQILEKLGSDNLPISYISYLVNRLFGLSVQPDTVDTLTLIFFMVALVVSLVLNIRDFIHRRNLK